MSFEYVLWEISYQNFLMYLAAIPQYDYSEKEAKPKVTNDPDELTDFFRKLEANNNP